MDGGEAEFSFSAFALLALLSHWASRRTKHDTDATRAAAGVVLQTLIDRVLARGAFVNRGVARVCVQEHADAPAVVRSRGAPRPGCALRGCFLLASVSLRCELGSEKPCRNHAV